MTEIETTELTAAEILNAEILDDAEAEALIADAPEPADVFCPDTAEKADWVLGKIADVRQRAARVRENAEKIARAYDAEAEALEWKFGPALQAWLTGELAGGTRKSKRLYNGVLGFRTKPAGVSVVNPAAALDWARVSCPAAVCETLDRKTLASALLDTGEAVDFAAFTPAEEVFYIK